ncbi:A-kinase anchor protein 6, partial [Lates japonicus]
AGHKYAKLKEARRGDERQKKELECVCEESLCSEVRARRRGVASVLKLCQKLLQQSQSGPMAEVGPEAEQHREALQLLSINLERRWEAIVMQALQWQNRLKRELGEQQVPGNFLEPGLVDLRQISPVPVGPVAPAPDDSWEWDETDMTITEPEPQEVPEPDLTHNLPTDAHLPSDGVVSNGSQLDRGSSLESLLALGVELFPSKDPLHRSASLESCLAPSRIAEEETGGSLASLGELDLGQSREVDGGEPGKEKSAENVGEPSSGELSRRTLDLLKRLENIQSPLAAKMTRSVSDMTLRSSSPQRSRIPASPSFGGRHTPLSGISGSSRKGPPSMINESSATASLTELSSTEDSSLGSEDFAMLRNQRRLFLDPTMAANANSGSYRKRGHGNSRGGQGMDEADGASLSMVVNVSCTSACTDEDEDDSDLLSSSTLTLTEEELGVRDGEDEEEERLSGASSGNEDDEDDDEEEMEGSYVLGLEYMKRELQSWIRSPRTSSSSSSKTEAGLRDELQCGTNLSSTFTTSSQNKEQHCFLNHSAEKLIETNTNSGNNKTKRDRKEQEEEEENRRNTTRSYISQFVDDVENGNVDQSCLKGKDEDDELLREESSVFTKKGESVRESIDEGKKENVHDFVMEIIDLTSLALKSKENQPEEQNQAETSGSNPDQGPASLTQIKDKVLEHSHRPLHLRKGDFYSYLSLSSHDSDCGEVSQCSEDKSSTPAPYSIPSYTTPTQGLHSPSPELFTSTKQQISTSNSAQSSKRSSPLLDSRSNLCALDLKSAERQANGAANGSCAEEPTSPSLSLPPSPDIRDEETLFAACTEEVYLGPPLCYSMVLTRKPRRYLLKENLEDLSSLDPGYKLNAGLTSFSTSSPSTTISASLQGPDSKPKDETPSSPPPVSSGAKEEKRGEDPYLLCDVAGREVAVAASVSAPQEERSRNEGPPYLNPWARVAPIDSSAAECLADTKTLESNMGAVMTKISVCSSATNPSKEPAATRINPKINCSAMREADREEGERRGEVDTRRVKQEEKGRRGRSGSQQEAKTVAAKQVSSQSAVNHSTRAAQGRSQASVRHPTSRTGMVSRLLKWELETSRIQL